MKQHTPARIPAGDNIPIEGPEYLLSNPLESVSSTVPSRILVYQCLLSFLQDVSHVQRSESITSTLHEHYDTMSASDSVSALVKSRESRIILLQVASHYGISSDPRLRDALHEDETRIATYLVSILDSQAANEAVLALEGDAAQHFLDVIQHTLDRGLLIAQEHNSKAQRMMIKLSNAYDKFPSSLFITGVSGRDDYATFGGGFGDIYRASYDGKTIALKHMRTFHRGSELRRIRLQFYREALIWQHLKHLYILPMLGIDQESFPSSLCMVSPWMENGTVLKYLEEHGRQEVDKLLWEVAQGLEYLHSRNIVHGDLRGANILITQHWSACLADFGLTSFTDTTVATTTSHRAGAIRWMAPELIDPDRFGLPFRRTTAADVYAFACVCLELYTGRAPFANMTEAGVILKIVHGERPARPSTTPPMSEALWKCVNEWWVEDPATRPPTKVVVRNIAMCQEQAIMPLRKFSMQGYVDAAGAANASANNTNRNWGAYASATGGNADGDSMNGNSDKADSYLPGLNGTQPIFTEVRLALLAAHDDGPFSDANGRAPYEVPLPTASSTFAPVSPDQNQHQHHNQQGLYVAAEMVEEGQDSCTVPAQDSSAAAVPHLSKTYVGYLPKRRVTWR
ncbi:kinase-like domain-containing protein [Mycena rebaudengoi]|nr:kinase-like domain-containing protein [Mycena rebaudengoi]